MREKAWSRRVIARLEALMAHETAGDPLSGLKWTRRTTAKIAAELGALGIDICARTVARLLKALGFSLRVNHKKLAGASHPNRDDQFRQPLPGQFGRGSSTTPCGPRSPCRSPP